MTFAIDEIRKHFTATHRRILEASMSDSLDPTARLMAAGGDRFIDGLRRYADQHIETGGFLRAVLENNLKEACGMADEDAQNMLWSIVNYCYNEIPSTCWGSPEKVAYWLSIRHDDPAEPKRD